MYLKWIECKVENEFRAAFAKAQAEWIETKHTKGFIGQIGGWEIHNNNQACILAFWEDENFLRDFMENVHDKIFNNSKQVKTYKSISVNYFNLKFNMLGSKIDLTERIKNATFLRIADCKVKPNKVNHFEDIQKSVWMPGMKETNGMLGGEFSVSGKDSTRYLVSTLWDNANNHKNYVVNILPNLQNKSDINNNLDKISGKQILLETSWRII